MSSTTKATSTRPRLWTEAPWLSSRRARKLYRKVRGRAGELRRQAVHRVRGPLVLRRRHHRVRRRHRGGCCGTPASPTVRPSAWWSATDCQHAAAIIGFLAAGRPVSMIYSFQSPESIARDIEKLELSAIVADREDWTDEVIAAAKRAGSAGVAISLTSAYRRAPSTVWSVATIPVAHAAGRIRCGAADSHQRYHRPAEAAGDQDTGAGTHGVQRDQRRERLRRMRRRSSRTGSSAASGCAS